MSNKIKNTGELLFEIDRSIEGGTYSNMANVVHNKNEFLIDFGISLPGKKPVKVQSRIISSPLHAKQLLIALNNNIAKYEEKFGTIEVDQLPKISNTTHTVH